MNLNMLQGLSGLMVLEHATHANQLWENVCCIGVGSGQLRADNHRRHGDGGSAIARMIEAR